MLYFRSMNSSSKCDCNGVVYKKQVYISSLLFCLCYLCWNCAWFLYQMEMSCLNIVVYTMLVLGHPQIRLWRLPACVLGSPYVNQITFHVHTSEEKSAWAANGPPRSSLTRFGPAPPPWRAPSPMIDIYIPQKHYTWLTSLPFRPYRPHQNTWQVLMASWWSVAGLCVPQPTQLGSNLQSPAGRLSAQATRPTRK